MYCINSKAYLNDYTLNLEGEDYTNIPHQPMMLMLNGKQKFWKGHTNGFDFA